MHWRQKSLIQDFLTEEPLQPNDLAFMAKNRSFFFQGQDLPDKYQALKEILGLDSHPQIGLNFSRCAYREGYYWDNSKISLGKHCIFLGYRTNQKELSMERRWNRDPISPLSNQASDLEILNISKIDWSSEKYWEKINTTAIEIKWQSESIWLFCGLEIAHHVFGIFVNDKNRYQREDREYDSFYSFKEPILARWDLDFDFTLENWKRIQEYYFHSDLDATSIRNILIQMKNSFKWIPTDDLKKPGLKKLYESKLKSLGEELFENNDLLYWMALRSLLKDGSKSVRKVRVSVILNHEFASLENVDQLKEKLDGFLDVPSYENVVDRIENFDFFKEKRKQAVRRDTNKAIRTRVKDLDEIDLDKGKYPLTYAAFVEGKIPLTCIFPAEETYFLINSEWSLWEEMLLFFPKETQEIAVQAGARKNYERDLMSYFYFLLHDLPEYLEKHTGETWTCSPKLVESQWELEPAPVKEDRGVVKHRSAMTPIVDNETKHVVIPYVSMRISGRQTTYCYAHGFYVCKKGMMHNGNVVIRETERFNGKDDYGLMFYTLTGSYTNRGYPTFLIIFERLKSKKEKTRVHFHRVHPMRSKSGDRNPIHNWMKVSYNWMIGNININDICFQQGDLAFVKISDSKKSRLDFSKSIKVSECDSHCFSQPVSLLPYDGKDPHILGHIKIDQKHTKLNHPEHDNVSAPIGEYEIRQCRSWEANPKGIWTLNYD